LILIFQAERRAEHEEGRMDLAWALVGPGLIGGLVFALLLTGVNRMSKRRTAWDPFGRDPVSTDIINIARIRVAGIGGLGLVAMAVAVAIAVPRIGRSLAIGFLLGVLLAAGLVVWRRRTGPLPSSGRRAGANTTLSIDSVPESRAERRATK